MLVSENWHLLHKENLSLIDASLDLKWLCCIWTFLVSLPHILQSESAISCNGHHLSQLRRKHQEMKTKIGGGGNFEAYQKRSQFLGAIVSRFERKGLYHLSIYTVLLK